MEIRQNVSLKDYSTMRLGGQTRFLTEVTNRQELEEVIAWAEERKLPLRMIGSGSNIVWKDEGFEGLIIVNKILGFEEFHEDDENYYVTVGAGEVWDAVVERTVAKGMTGIEGLSLIPGTAGATPIQNVGAYGQEISQTLVSLTAYDLQTKQFVTIQNVDCGFSYRKSRFNSDDQGRFLITSITLHLLRGNPKPPYYRTVQLYFDEHGITGECTPKVMRDAVIAIRSSKLPDPAKIANNGSFFGNPVIDKDLFSRLQDKYGDIPHRDMDDGQVKLAAAWLIEKIGLKGFSDPETGMATWPLQPLVFVNEKAQTTAQLLVFRQKILDAVEQEFGIILKQEPELLP